MIDYLIAFLVGGALCATAQLLIDKTRLTPAKILVGFVCSGVFLTAIGVYEHIVSFAKCGATVPLSGFGYAIAMGVREAVYTDGLWGALTGGLTATSGGITFAICIGLICSLIFNSKMK